MWYKLNKSTNKYEYNHYNDYKFQNRDKPIPETSNQLNWNNNKWKSKMAYITNDGIIVYRFTVALKFIFYIIWAIMLITALIFGIAGISVIIF